MEKIFYFVSPHGEVMGLKKVKISNDPKDQKIISELTGIALLDGWEVEFQSSEKDDLQLFELVEENNQELSEKEQIIIPETAITVSEYVQFLREKFKLDED